MKNLFCERLAAILCMKQPPSASVEPPLIRRNKQNVVVGDHIIMDTLHDNDTTPSDHTTERESMQQLMKEIRDLLKTRVHSEEEQRYKTDIENETKNDWMLAAAVLDRICAIAFAIIFVGGTLAFFLPFACHQYC